jgi:transposase
VKPIAPLDRVLPSNTGPGPVTAISVRLPGETGGEALERIGAAVLPAEDPNKKKGRRARSKQRKLPRQLAAIIAMRTEGMSNRDIAEKMNLSVATIGAYLQKARKELHLSDIVDRVEHRAVPTAVDNLIEGLDRGDKDYTLATLKGVGVFRNHSAVKQETSTENRNLMVVRIEMPELTNGQLPTVAVGNIVGVPRAVKAVEGELV